MAFADILKDVNNYFQPLGLESHGFKVGWYNDKVGKEFHFPYDYDTFAVLVISTPDMFDKTLIPYIHRSECPGTGDPLDQCLAEHFKMIKQKFPNIEIEVMHDYEMLPSRRPKVLVQTAGHVSGAAFYYQQSDMQPDPWAGTGKKMFGVSIHPKYGGWFALRGVLIFKSVLCPELVKKEPVDCVPTMELRKELLERFNYNWQDWTYRDIIPVEKKYSEQQKQYFATLPKDRPELIKSYK